jgi:hypothetical protein
VDLKLEEHTWSEREKGVLRRKFAQKKEEATKRRKGIV